MNKIFRFCIFILIAALFGACNENVSTPKPRGYYRVALPEHSYQVFDTNFPYRFEYSTFAEVLPDFSKHSEKYWINLHYPTYNATIYISYKTITDNFDTLTKDSRMFVTKQIKKAEDIIEYNIIDTVNHIYGKTYEILGNDVACPYQFWISDREKHFFRAALYFNTTPNNDSLVPVIQYVKEDLLHLIETFTWKE